MATNKETREIEILLDGQKANASLKEMAAAAALMTNQLAKMAADDPRRDALKADFQDIRKRVAETRSELNTYIKSEAELREENEQLTRSNQQVVLNGQKVSSSFKEMRQAGALLEQQLHELSADDPGRGKMLADYRSLQTRIEHVNKEIRGTKPALESAAQSGGFFKNAMSQALGVFTGGGLLSAAQGIFSFFSTARQEYQEGTNMSAQLDASLRSTGNAAGLTADEIKKIGVERAKVTLFDDDETNSAASLLTTFTNIKKGVFEEALPAVQDLATKMAGGGEADLKGAAVQLGKALNDPIRGITALSRVGVSFTEQQKEQITTMVKAGNAAGAQKLILAELNREFGGSATEARKAAGGMGTLNMTFGKIKESVGEFIQGGLNVLSDWLQKILDKSQPLIDIFAEFGDEIAVLYNDILELLQGLGLFNDAGDTASTVVKGLTWVFTLLLTPIRAGIKVIDSLVTGFVTLYNKSELLRGVLGGLAAVVVGTFKTIKDDALKYLGGVADLLVGVFTLDMTKIKAGLKKTFEATEDVLFKSGMRNAKAFVDGYNANKDKLIVRKPKVAGEEPAAGGGAPAGSGGEDADEPSAKEHQKAEKEREKAARKAEAAAKKEAQDRLNNLKEWIKEEGQHLAYRSALNAQREGQEMTDAQKRRELERQRIFDDADKQYDGLSEKEQAQDDVVAALMEARNLKLRELAAKFAEEDEKERQKKLDQKIAEEQMKLEENLVQLEIDLANGVINEQAYQDALYAVKMAAAARELALVKDKNGVESNEYRKLHGALLKEEAQHNAKVRAEQDGMVKFGKSLQSIKKMIGNEEVDALGEVFGKKSGLYKAFVVAQKALALTEIGLNLAKEMQNNSLVAAQNPLNGPTAGAAGVAQLILSNGFSLVRAGVATAKVVASGFLRGGRTSPSAGSTPAGQLDLGQLSTGSDGKLRDQNGDEVAGIVHANEYVIPEWMRSDPKVMQMEQYLEGRRLRGYREGGATSDEAPAVAGRESADETPALLRRLIQVQEQQNDRLNTWARELVVELSTEELERELDSRKQARLRGSLR